MKFIDSKHREFWNEKYKEMQIMEKQMCIIKQ